MLNRAVWIFFFDNLGVPGMHSPLCRQWASTWAWTVGFPGIRFSTYLNTFHKADFYLCSSVWCSGWTEKHPARALERVNNRTHAGFPFWPLPSLPCPHPNLPHLSPLLARKDCGRSYLLGTGLIGPICLADAEPSQKFPWLWCPGLDSSWANSPPSLGPH